MKMAKTQLRIVFDAHRCLQCHACEAACKSLHQLEPGIFWRKVWCRWEGQYPDLRCRVGMTVCRHCVDPRCLRACPTNAISKRQKDGLVLVDPDLCTGCRDCLQACPFDVPRFGADGKMQKCDFCRQRIDSGLVPLCVATCPSDALTVKRAEN